MKKRELQKEIFYHIYPLGLCGCPLQNDFSATPTTRIESLYEWIPYLKNLGITAMYWGPVFESTSHGYDTTNYYYVDRRLGDNDSVKRLITEFHKVGIQIVLDGVFNHVGRDFWAFKDVQQNGSSSRFRDWFSGIRFDQRSPYGDNFSYEGWNGHYNLVKLNLQNIEVEQHLLGAVEMWMNELGIDGLRLDAADCVNINFQKKLSGFTKNINPDFFLLGEIIHGDYRTWVNDETLDSVTNYECYKGLYSSHNDRNYFEIAYSLKRQFGEKGIYKNVPLYAFADNHDVNRVASQLHHAEHLFLLYTLLFTMPGIPSLYYGSEWGMTGVKQNGSDLPLRPYINARELPPVNAEALLHHIQELIAIRRSSSALQFGSYRELLVRSEQFSFMRQSDTETLIVILNSSNQAVQVELDMVHFPDGEFEELGSTRKRHYYQDGKIIVHSLAPNSGILLRKKNIRE